MDIPVFYIYTFAALSILLFCWLALIFDIAGFISHQESLFELIGPDANY